MEEPKDKGQSLIHLADARSPGQLRLNEIAGSIEMEKSRQLWTSAIACVRAAALAFLPRKKTDKKMISKVITFGPDCRVRVKYSVPEDCVMPFGADRYVFFGIQHLARSADNPLIEFDKAGELLDMFGLGDGGAEYRSLRKRLERLKSLNIEIQTEGMPSQRGMGSRVIEEWNFPTRKEAKAELAGQELLRLSDRSPYFVRLSEGLFNRLKRGGPEENVLLLRLDLLRHFRDSPIGWDFCVFLMHRCGSAKSFSQVPHSFLMEFFKAGSEADARTIFRLKKLLTQIKEATGDALNANFVSKEIPRPIGRPRKEWSLQVGPSQNVIFGGKKKLAG